LFAFYFALALDLVACDFSRIFCDRQLLISAV
jgi:hypothetical protein